MKPFLKWVGGKTQIIEQVISKFPHDIKDYYEPFIGGGSVLLSFLENVNTGNIVVHGNIYATDNNESLIWTYRNVQRNVNELIDELAVMIKLYNNCAALNGTRKPSSLQDATVAKESLYYWFRKEFNDMDGRDLTKVRASALFIFLNKTCFRGLYREGPNGFNVPFGNYNNPQVYDEQHLRDVSRLIQGVNFIACDFHEALADVNAGDFVYLDPPYVPLTKTSFVKYNSDGFSLKTHELLFNICNSFQGKEVKMLMSNADAEIIHEHFSDSSYCINKIQCKRSIHSKRPNAVAMEVFVSTMR